MKIYSTKLPTIRQLQCFLAVCEENSFRKAALKIGITQPPLSRHIMVLEERLSTPLFFRNTQQVKLTKAGEDLKIQAEKLLNELYLLTVNFKSYTADKGIIGLTKSINFNFIPVVNQFMGFYADDLLFYSNMYTSKELLVELHKGNIDFIIISESTDRRANEKYLLVYQEPMVLALPTIHPESNNEYIDLNNVCDLPLYWFPRYQNPKLYDQCEQVFDKLHYPLIRKTELPDTLAMLMEISLGQGMALLPASISKANILGVTYKKMTRDFEQKLRINIYIVWHQDSEKKPSFKKVINYFDNNTLA